MHRDRKGTLYGGDCVLDFELCRHLEVLGRELWIEQPEGV